MTFNQSECISSELSSYPRYTKTLRLFPCPWICNHLAWSHITVSQDLVWRGTHSFMNKSNLSDIQKSWNFIFFAPVIFCHFQSDRHRHRHRRHHFISFYFSRKKYFVSTFSSVLLSKIKTLIFFLKTGHPLFVYFCLFKQSLQDSNTQPLEHQSHSITTRQGLPPNLDIVCLYIPICS